jgi:hypothetical protein
MPEYCTCGTQLVEDSRFCHKCGRPTSGEPEIPASAPRIILSAPVLSAPVHSRISDSPVTFANPVVLRIAFAAAAFSILLDFIPFFQLLCVIWSMGAGFMAVWMYCKRTGLPLSVGSGAKLGWITGVFSFVILTIMTTATVAFSGEKMDEIRKQVTAQLPHDANYQDALNILQNPSSFATVILFMLFLFFLLLLLASVAGGAIGARFSNKQ